MPSAKPAPDRKNRSGSYIPDSMRDGAKLEIRCTKELAKHARRVARASGRTLAQVLALGIDALERMPPRELTDAEDESACRADIEYERMREDGR